MEKSNLSLLRKKKVNLGSEVKINIMIFLLPSKLIFFNFLKFHFDFHFILTYKK